MGVFKEVQMGLAIRKGDERYDVLLALFRQAGGAGQFTDGSAWWVGILDGDSYVFAQVGTTGMFDKNYGDTSISTESKPEVSTEDKPKAKRETKKRTTKK
jgi:hypothetical protein